jgi:hypothetical protein
MGAAAAVPVTTMSTRVSSRVKASHGTAVPESEAARVSARA